MKSPLFTLAGSLFLASICLADDPSAVLSAWFTSPPTVTGSALTSLATAILSIQSTWLDSPQYTSAIDAIAGVAPTSDFNKLSTLVYAQVTALPWWTNVPEFAKSAVASEEAAVESVTNKFTSGAGRRALPGDRGTLVAMAAGFLAVVGVLVAL